ncbi:MAG: hypothetical protein HBSAPP03_07350 [Phycisphaerae bacterium]|nr:MAG: hypothetical protein HBSAPP03_07350 [Phycisphaerae bacterium]
MASQRSSFLPGLVAASLFALGSPLASLAQCDQTGTFTAFAPHWTASNGSSGMVFPNATEVIVDVNGNGTTSLSDPVDLVFAVPPEIQSNRFTTALSPTREFLVVVGGTSPFCSAANQKVRVYRLEHALGSMTLVHEDCLPCTVFQGPLFYDTGAVPPSSFPAPITGQRIMLFRTGAGAPCSPSNQAMPLLRWYDLNTPGSAGIADTDLGLLPGVNQNNLRVSRSGLQAFVQHDLTNNPADSDFDIINLCQGSSFGQIVPNELGPRINDFSGAILPVASTVSAGPGGIVVQMLVSGSPIYQATLANCCVGAPTGACCVNGGCVITTQAQCGGTWTQGASCEQAQCPPPPIVSLAISIAAPALVVQRQEFDYVLTYRNNGGLAAQNVTATDVIPSAFTFISASNGGTFNAAQNRVNWSLGTLPGNSGPQTLTVRVRAGCNVAYYTNSSYSISATGASANGSNSATTYVNYAPVVGSVSGSITSTPVGTPPLIPGDVIHHVMTITNTSAEQLTGIKWTGYAGYPAAFTTLVNHGSGTLTMPYPNGSALEWTGNLAPWQSTTIAFDAVITPCVSISGEGAHLNGGMNWVVQTPCGASLGSFPTTAPIAVLPTITAALAAIPVPNAIGPLTQGSGAYPEPMQTVRGTPNIDLVLTIANTGDTAESTMGITLDLPFNWIISNPPFLGNVPAGFSYDHAMRLVTYTGSIPPGGLPPVTVRVRPNAPINGAQNFTIYNQPNMNCNAIIGELSLVNMPTLPTEPLILGVEKWYTAGTWTIRPGIDPLPVPYFSRAEVWYGIHVEPNGDLWLAGAPTFMFNPATLDVAFTPGLDDYLESIGLDDSDICDVAVDPIDGTLVLTTQRRSGNPNGAPPAIVRYNRTTAQCSLITRDPILAATEHYASILIEPDGTIFVCNRNVLARIPRATPTPIPDGQVPIIAVPHPTYALGPTAGTLSTQKPHALGRACTGEMLLLHASLFANGTNPDGLTIDSTVYALSSYNPASNAITVHVPQAAVHTYSQSMGRQPSPIAFSPVLPPEAVLDDACITGGEAGHALIANNYYPYHCIYDFDLASGTPTVIEPATPWHLRGAADIAYLNGSCNPGPSCDPDVNCDGAVNGLDVEIMELAVGGDTTDFCQSDTDFNQDGASNGLDVEAVELAVGGSPCP